MLPLNPSSPSILLGACLVPAGGSLAGLDLLHVPAADRHVAIVLLQAVGQVLGRETAVNILLLVLVGVLLRGSGLGRCLGGGTRRAAEHAHDAICDGVSNCDTSV